MDRMPAEVEFKKHEKYELQETESKEGTARCEKLGFSSVTACSQEVGIINDAADYQ